MLRIRSYKGKIYRTVLLIGIAGLFCISLLLGLALSNDQKAKYLQHLSSTASLMETNATVSMTTISKAILELTTEESLSKLSQSKSFSEFLYNSISVSRAMQKTTTDLMAVDYQISITMLEPLAFDGKQADYMISSQSTNSFSDFLEQNRDLSPEELQNAFEYFETNTRPLLVPVYQDGKLHEFHYYVRHKIDKVPFLFFVRIPEYTLIGNASALHYILFTPKQILATDMEDQSGFDYKALFGQVTKTDPAVNHLYFQSNPVILTSIAPSGWQVACVYDRLNYRFQDILLFLTLIGLLFFSLMAAIKFLTERLYRPVREAIIDTIAPEDLHNGEDEFALIRQNSLKIQSLSQELQKTMQLNNQLSSQQSLQELLFSDNVNYDHYAALLEPDKPYCVARFSLHAAEHDANLILMQKTILSCETSASCHSHYVSIDHNHCGFILQCDDPDQAKQFLFSALHAITDGAELENTEPYAALSRIHPGIESIRRCYLETLKIQEYRPLFSRAKIITTDQIAAWDTITYSYPLSLENKLIQYTIDGKSEALELFSHLIRENIRDKDLPPNIMQNLVYALIGTIIRIFQELKTTPEEYLHESINFQYFYDNWSDSTTISMIKSTLENIIAVTNERKLSSDEELIQQMRQYIYDNYWDNIMLNDMADHFNISPKYCGILFKELSEDNFKNFLNHYRIEEAKKIIEKNPSIKVQDLSKQVGFNSANSFLRVFRKYTGLTPTEYIQRIVTKP